MSAFFARLLPWLGLLATVASAHPLPDIPVRSHFDKDGNCTIKVEIDPRCFTADPESERYTMKADLKVMTELERQELLQKARDAVMQWVEFEFDPQGKLKPEFDFALTGLGEAELVNFDDPLVITGTYRMKIPAGSKGWRIHATDKTPFAVVFKNYLAGVEQPRFSVLFAGETSFKLELTTASATN
jgi:hypothetical protein